jgi:thioester reductase-like protein
MGVPVVIFRPCDVSGDTSTGYSNFKDTINIIVSGIAKLGCYLFVFIYFFILNITIGIAPLTEVEFEMCPVDAVSRSIVHISKLSIPTNQTIPSSTPSSFSFLNNKNNFGKIFHYNNPDGKVSLLQLVNALRRCSLQIEEVDYATWLDRVSQAKHLPMYPTKKKKNNNN